MTRTDSLSPRLVLYACLLVTSQCSATITMTDSGQRFRAQVDPHLGKPLWTGYDYYARLQALPLSTPLHNTTDNSTALSVSDLCEPPAVLNLTIPADGLPVALLVQGGGCSTQQKIDIALQYVQPAPLLRFLIINDVDHHEHPPNDYVKQELTKERIREFLLPEHTSNEAPSNVIPPDAAPKQDYGDPPEKVIPLHILHITNPVYEQLVSTYLTPSSQASGGPRVTIDSTSSAGYYGLLDNMTALWISLFAICSACACTILILVGNSVNHQHEWEEWNRQQQLQQQRQRRQRRRLTREQIRRLLPQYRYDGTILNLVHSHVVDQGSKPLDDEHAHLQDALLAPPSSLEAQPPATLSIPLELDCCSVCLDDYEVGDKIRVLPCHHCFHSRCVGRWLAERSATCPLCKTELWPEEEEGEDDEEEEQRQDQDAQAVRPALEEDSFWNRLFFGSNQGPAAVADNVPAVDALGTEQEMTTLHPRQESDGEQPTDVARVARRSWLRRMFPSHGPWGASTRSDEENETRNMLAEPLLADEEAGHVEGVSDEREQQEITRESSEQVLSLPGHGQDEEAPSVPESHEEQPSEASEPEPTIQAEPTEASPRQVSV